MPKAMRSSALSERMADHDAAGIPYGVAQRDRPEMLDGEHERGASVGQVVEQSDGHGLGERRRVGVDRVCDVDAGDCAVDPADTESDEGTDRCA